MLPLVPDMAAARRSLDFFLFWNIGGRRLETSIARIAAAEGIDLIILAECEVPTRELLAELSAATGTEFTQPYSNSAKLGIFTRFDPSAVTAVFDDASSRLTIRRVVVGEQIDFLLAATHFHSRRNWSEDDQLIECTKLAADISRIEAEFGHQRTLLVGDLNMNPFDKAVISAAGLHGAMTAQVARRRSRVVAARTYPFFYNPMWGLFGDRTAGPPGTHYFDGAHVSYFWNMYDQVLLRPDIMDSLRELRVLEGDGTTRFLLPSGRFDPKTGSDHLPLFFRLDL